MIRKLATIVLTVLLLNLSVVNVLANSNTEKEIKHGEKVKEGIRKLGTGEASIVKIKLRDKTKVEGYVSEINEDTLVVINSKTGVSTSVAYPNVKQIQGNNLSTKTKILIGAGIAAVILIVVLAANGNIGGRNRTLEEAFKKNPPLPTSP